jgi:hypothetical protein
MKKSPMEKNSIMFITGLNVKELPVLKKGANPRGRQREKINR